MIELYTGTPGSGKSLHCAREIYHKLISGHNVIANFDINLSCFPAKKRKKLGKFVYRDNSDISVDFLLKFAFENHRRNVNGHVVEGQTVLVLDECQIMFNSRDWNAKDRMKWCTFFTQHRKYGFNIILITQFDRLIDRQIRSLVEYQVIHRNISNFKTLGWILGFLCGGRLFVALKEWYCMREKISSEFFILHKRYTRLYDSYKIFDSLGGGGLGGSPPNKGEKSINIVITPTN